MDNLEGVIHQNLKGHGVSDRFADTAKLQWIKSKVLSVRVKSQSDIGSMDNLESVIHQNLKGHGMSDRLADTDEMSAILT
jgi:hypothetical protein